MATSLSFLITRGSDFGHALAVSRELNQGLVDEIKLTNESIISDGEEARGERISRPTRNKTTSFTGDANAASSSSPQVSGEDEYAICVVIMDDNHRLPEWIAYRYFTLILRHLVVANDPFSKTSLSPIFDRWRDRMEIT